MKQFGLAVLIVMLITGCSLTREMPPAQSYHLDTATLKPLTAAYCSDRVLRIALIQAPEWMQGTDIYYTGEQNRMYRYTRARWEQTPVSAMQQISEKSVIDSGLFKAVVPYKSLAKNDWLLELRMETMVHHIDAERKGRTELMLYGVLIDQYSRRVIEKKPFRYIDERDTATVQSAVEAWSFETKAFQGDLVNWLKQACNAYPKPERSRVDLR